jgi:surface antigen
MRRQTVGAALAAIVLVAGCESTGGTKETVGTLVGAGTGALIGSQIGGGSGKLAAVAIGTLAGAYLGKELGKSLYRADQMAMERTTQNALETNPSGNTSTWRNPDSGHSGNVTPTGTVYNSTGEPCRSFDSSIYVNGRYEMVSGLACRRIQPDGTAKWVVVQ